MPAFRLGDTMSDDALLELCHRVVDAVAGAVAGIDDLSPAGSRPGQYALDLVADRAALEVLDESGLGVLSEESGRHRPWVPVVAVLDPVDGSTNASRGLPWYACSICFVEGLDPRASVVADLARGTRYWAVRGGGAWRDDARLQPSGCTELRHAIVALSGYPSRHLGWAQFRAFGAAALDLCAVAEGTIDAFTTGQTGRLAPWDYLGALLICREAGVDVTELGGAELVSVDHGARRAVTAAASAPLLDQLVAAVGAGAAR
jgi:fructose-1,6-bisphosphatase/inositol monophosphatase family enzyme